MPPPPDGVPMWIWKAAAWVVGGLLTLLATILGFFGKRYVDRRDEQIRSLREQMQQEHSDVEDQVERIDTKLDRILEEL